MTKALEIYDNFQQTRAIAESLAASDLVPDHFKRKPSNVLIALEFAHRNDIAPFAAMQSMFVIHGRVGMTAAMAISLARKHNVWKKLTYRVSGKGDSLEVTAIATLHDDEVIESTVTMAQAKAAGWTKAAVYQSIPEQMLRYRAATFLIRAHFPEVLFGMSTTDEIEDIEASKRPSPVKKIEPIVIEAPVNEVKEPEQVIDIAAKKEELVDVLTNMNDAWFENLNQKRDVMLQQIVNENDHNKISRMYDYVKERI